MIQVSNKITDMNWGELTIKEMDLLMSILYVSSEITDGQNVQMNLIRLKRSSGIQNYKAFYNALNDFAKKQVVDSVTVDPERKTVIVRTTVQISNRPCLTLDVDMFKALHKKAAKIIYLNLRRYIRGWRVTTDDFKTKVGINMETPNKYILRDVIKPALVELNKHGICARCEVIKKSRCAEAFVFCFDHNQ